MTTDSDKEALARRASTAIDVLVNAAFERLRSERQKWDGTEANRGAWDQARQSWERISNLVADYKRALDMFGWGHPATNGCLLALVREAWGDPRAFVSWMGHELDSGWRVWVHHDADSGSRVCTRDSEVEALVAALEAVP